MSVIAAAVVLAGTAAPAHATLYNVMVYEASVGAPFNAANSSMATLLASPNYSTASFNYNGALNFSNTTDQNSTPAGDTTSTFFGTNAGNISAYTPGVLASSAPYGSFATQASYLQSSGSIAGYGYGSLYTFTAVNGSYGGTNLTITHDDGVSVYANGVLLPGTTAGATAAITETVTLPTGTTSYEVAYSRENGSPSILNVAVPRADVPSRWWALAWPGLQWFGAGNAASAFNVTCTVSSRRGGGAAMLGLKDLDWG